MLQHKSAHAIGAAVLAAMVVCLLAGPAMATYTIGTTLVDYWSAPASGRLMDLTVKATVWDIASDGSGFLMENNVKTGYAFSSYGGSQRYAYSYDLFVGAANNEENPEWFQVNWGPLASNPRIEYGNVSVSPNKANWLPFSKNASAGGGGSTGGTPPVAGTGDYVTWQFTGSLDNPYLTTPNNWLGTFWVVSEQLPVGTDGLAPDTVVASGRTIAAVPEPASWALLALAMGVPLYIRRRKRS